MSSMFGFFLFLRSVYMDMTMPGVQNPHWDPCEFAILSWTAWSLVLKKKKQEKIYNSCLKIDFVGR